MLIAQFTDLHIVKRGALVLDRVNTAARLVACIKTLRALVPKPGLLILSGDLTDNGEADEYRHLRDLLETVDLPVFVMPGNHDRRNQLRRSFIDHLYLGASGPINYCLEYPGLRLLLLDTLVEGEDWGELIPETIYWLITRLSEAPQTPTIVFLHHPPVHSGERSLDAIALRNAEKLGEIIENNPQVAAVIGGHFHRALSVRWHGTTAVVAPSTAQAIALNFVSGAPLSYTLEPPAFCLHHWDELLLTSHFVQAGDFPGPFPYP